jgi:hypothetical protein
MATWQDVNRLALTLPETAATPLHGDRAWKVRDKLIVWERPLRKGDLAALQALGRTAPDGPILGARVEHEGAKLALIESDPDVFFTIPHFDGYPAVLVRLERIDVPELQELIVEAWLSRAPKRLAGAYLAERGSGGE